jgi:hypothetical protein
VRSAEARSGLPLSPPLPGALQTWLLWRWPFLRRRYGPLADGETHWRGRTMLSPAFSQRAIDKHLDTVRDLAEREIATWPRDVPLPLHDRLRSLTLRALFARSRPTAICSPSMSTPGASMPRWRSRRRGTRSTAFT